MPDYSKNIGTFVKKFADDSVEEPRELYRFQISDESINVNAWQLLTAGGDFTEYLSNPLVYWAHDTYWSYPIGRCENLFVEGGKIFADIWFHEEDERSIIVKKLVDVGIIISCSIGIFPQLKLEGNPLPTNLVNKTYSWDNTYTIIQQWILKEISITNIGANKSARLKKKLTEATKQGLMSEQDAILCFNALPDESMLYTNFNHDEKAKNIIQNQNEESKINDSLNNQEVDMTLEVENATLKKDLEAVQKREVELTEKFKALEVQQKDSTSKFSELDAKFKAQEAELAKLKDDNQKLNHTNYVNEEKSFCEKLKSEGKLMPKENENDAIVSLLVELRENNDSAYRNYQSILNAREPVVKFGEEIAVKDKAIVPSATGFTMADAEGTGPRKLEFHAFVKQEAAKNNHTFKQQLDIEKTKLNGGA